MFPKDEEYIQSCLSDPGEVRPHKAGGEGGGTSSLSHFGEGELEAQQLLSAVAPSRKPHSPSQPLHILNVREGSFCQWPRIVKLVLDHLTSKVRNYGGLSHTHSESILLMHQSKLIHWDYHLATYDPFFMEKRILILTNWDYHICTSLWSALYS